MDSSPANTMKTMLQTIIAFIVLAGPALLVSCGTGFTTPPITIPEITIPPITLQQDTVRQKVDVTTHTTPAGIQTFTIDTVARTPHKARVRIATVYNASDAQFLARLWNASVAVSP